MPLTGWRMASEPAATVRNSLAGNTRVPFPVAERAALEAGVRFLIRILQIFGESDAKIELQLPKQLVPQLESGRAYFLPSYYAP